MWLPLPDIGGRISMISIQDVFDHKKAFIAFITAGDPTLDKTKDYIREMAKAGADLIEIGIPFSDPIAEGPTIQNANVRALKHNVTTDQVFDLVKDLRQDVTVPFCFMTYCNVVYHYGYDRFFKKCQEVGVQGIIIPDLPYEECQEAKVVAKNYDIKVISMIAPTSKERVEMIAKESEGFIYLVSSMGVTGVRDQGSFANNLEDIVAHIKSVTDVKVAVGFGIHEPKQAYEITRFADGAIVGSGIVNLIAKYGDHADQAVYDYVKQMSDATKAE